MRIDKFASLSTDGCGEPPAAGNEAAGCFGGLGGPGGAKKTVKGLPLYILNNKIILILNLCFQRNGGKTCPFPLFIILEKVGPMRAGLKYIHFLKKDKTVCGYGKK